MDAFRNFFRPDVDEQEFLACETILEISRLLDGSLKNQNTKIIIEKHDHFLVTGRPNEFKQVILNLITNAREAIAEKRREGGRIVFSFQPG